MSLERNTSDLNEILEMVEGLGDEEIVENSVYVNEDEKAVYDKDGETNQLDISMLTDKEGLLEQGGENPEMAVYVYKEEEAGLRPINSEDKLELGQTIYVDTDKLSSTAYYEINTDNGQLVLANTNNYYDWGISGCGLFGYGDFAPEFIQELTPNSGMVEYASHLSGKITSLTPYTPFYIYDTSTTSKAVYDEQGETKQLDLSMLSDINGLLGQGGGNTGGETTGSSVEVITVDDHDPNYEYVHIPLKGHSKCYILPFMRVMSGLSIAEKYISKDDSYFDVRLLEGGYEQFSVYYYAPFDELLISPFFYQGGGYPVTVILFD